MTRSLVLLVLLLVGGVVLLLGAGVVVWVTADDRAAGERDAAAQNEAAERELRAISKDLVADFQKVAKALVTGADRRLRLWIADEPLAIYRDPETHDLDVEALRRALSAEMSERSLAESEHVEIVADRMAAEAKARVDRVGAEQREEAKRRAAEAASARSRSLSLRLAMLLVGMALLLALTLWFLVIAPVRRLRGAVDRIARGDLRTPVPPGGGAKELDALSGDVERMRDQLRVLTTGLEEEVARKTESLEQTLAERTRALEELRATKDRLVQAEKMAGLGTLAGGVAHEFNNLLGGILGCVESARAETEKEAVREDLDVARRTAERAAKLVEALLGVARPGARTLAPVDLRRVVGDVLLAAGPAVERRGIRLTREDSGEPIVRGDEGQLHQVALNLVTNALQSVDDGEAIVVATRVEDRTAVLEVRDEGPGVPVEHRPRLFEPFFTGRPGGTGLGLFVSYGIVERHGGRIDVGDAPEGGARFTVRLPLAGAEP